MDSCLEMVIGNMILSMDLNMEVCQYGLRQRDRLRPTFRVHRVKDTIIKVEGGASILFGLYYQH